MHLAIHQGRIEVVAQPLGHQVAAIGGGIQQYIVRCLLQRAIQHALEHPVVALPGLERQVVAEQHEALPQTGQLLDDARQVGQLVALDLDQPQPIRGIFGQQRTHQRRLAGAARAPQQRMVGRQPGDELAGVAPQLLALAVDAEQIVQLQIQAHLQRTQGAVPALTLPARRQTAVPVDARHRLGQQRLDALEQLLDAPQKLTQSIFHIRTP